MAMAMTNVHICFDISLLGIKWMGKVRDMSTFCISLNLFCKTYCLCFKILPSLRSVSSAKHSQSFSSCKGSLSPFENVAWRQLRAALSFHKRGRKRNIFEGIPVAKFIVYAVKI